MSPLHAILPPSGPPRVPTHRVSRGPKSSPPSMTTLGPALAQGCNPQKKSSFPNLPKATTTRPQPRPGPGQRASTRVLTRNTETHTTHTRKSSSLSSELEAHYLDTVPANPEKPHPKAPPQGWAELLDPQESQVKAITNTWKWVSRNPSSPASSNTPRCGCPGRSCLCSRLLASQGQGVCVLPLLPPRAPHKPNSAHGQHGQKCRPWSLPVRVQIQTLPLFAVTLGFTPP